ncbi:MAG: Hsp20/alpha crystallin family protein [Blastocatellia bacterium]
MKPQRLLSDLAAIEQQLNQLFNHSLRDQEQIQASWSPAVDIFETTAQFVLTAEVPGVKSSEIDIKIVDNNLMLRGERRWERDAQAPGELFHRLESSYGKFERTFALSEQIDVEQISAEISRGVLTVILPKREVKTRRIAIEPKDE